MMARNAEGRPATPGEVTGRPSRWLTRPLGALGEHPPALLAVLHHASPRVEHLGPDEIPAAGAGARRPAGRGLAPARQLRRLHFLRRHAVLSFLSGVPSQIAH